jgi:hypothetical protein
MIGAEPIFTKFKHSKQLFVKASCTEFHEYPAKGLIAYILPRSNASGLHIKLFLPKECLKDRDFCVIN